MLHASALELQVYVEPWRGSGAVVLHGVWSYICTEKMGVMMDIIRNVKWNRRCISFLLQE